MKSKAPPPICNQILREILWIVVRWRNIVAALQEGKDSSIEYCCDRPTELEGPE
jgi:hypothetical protein